MLKGNFSETSKNTGPNDTPSYHGLNVQKWYGVTSSQGSPTFSPMERTVIKIALLVGIVAYAIYWYQNR